MSSAYEHDDGVYWRLESEGKVAWDQQGDPSATFDNFLLRPLLEETLDLIGANGNGRRALEVGCGTGPASCYLAERGFEVDAIDVSPHAVEMARRQARSRSLGIRFTVADICNLQLSSFGRYDLIVDGHCLHCIADDASLRKALSNIRAMLRDKGVFVMETMVWRENMQISDKYRYDDEGVLWLKGDPEVPYRRILRTDEIINELWQAGFSVHCQRVVDQQGENKPRLLQVHCQ